MSKILLPDKPKITLARLLGDSMSGPVVPLRHTRQEWLEDFADFKAGVLDRKSFWNGYKPRRNAVTVEVRRNGKLISKRYTHNTRTSDGTNLTEMMFTGASSATNNASGFAQTSPGTSVAITAPTSTTAGIVTDTNASITAATAALNQFIGYLLVYGNAATGPVCAHIVGNSASASSSVKWYFDNWFAPNAPGTAVTAPAANLPYIIVPSCPSIFFGLTSDATAVSAADHLTASEIGAGVTTASDLQRQLATLLTYALVSGTTNTGSYVLQKVYTAANTYNNVQKCGMFTAGVNKAAVAPFPNDASADLANVGKGGGVMLFENTFTSVNLLSGDQLTVKWTVNF